MTRKKFVKFMMAHGLDRNMANHLAEFGRSMNRSYFNMILPFFSMDREKEPILPEREMSSAFEFVNQTSTDTVTEKRKEGTEK